SRPRVSNDNPFSEALFKTVKYAPTFPERFATLADARAWMEDFTDWYNHEHHHAGIGLHTPADVHHHRTAHVQQARRRAIEQARQAHPERFAAEPALPKVLDLPTSAWINRPDDPAQAEHSSAA
ncbi:integrase core domain-containing protein, partial [Kineococcus arenarius]|uniref:integrase core domain-containing protein n=1 Tax=Kineococcus sp. SYSU DK007 TaxID=3383128 RepID=UPI003D7CC35A